MPKAEAVVSVCDSGFLPGDGVWEGVRLKNGRRAFLEAHLDRLFEAARAIDLDIGKDRAAVKAALAATAQANGMSDGVHARLMVTRGVKARPLQDPRLSRSGPTMVIIMEHSAPAEALWRTGIRLATVPIHRGLPLTEDPKLDSHSRLNCVLAAVHAQGSGAQEALMLDPHGFANTTNACNFFIVRRGELRTSTGDHCVPGITRANVIRVAREAGLPVHERNFSLVETYGAEEAFVTGTFGGLTPVAEIDGCRYAVPGPVTARLRTLYEALVEAETA